ncbi:ATP-binding cassette domain-containing protein [Candidatus Latescibacterota bacterium]
MSYREIILKNVSFQYDTSAIRIIEDCTTHFSTGWTGIVGANGSGKTTILRLATGELKPVNGHIATPVDTRYCEQRTDTAPKKFENLLRSTDSDACKIRGMLHLEDDWSERWITLSHGERKRAQIGTALWLRPDVLAIDEPTNHIDSEARRQLMTALKHFTAIGLLVSHDRDFIDGLCSQCLFIDPPHAVLRPGNYSAGAVQERREEESRQKQYNEAKKAYKRLHSEVVRRSSIAAQADKKRSKRGLKWKDSDSRSKINMARITGKDAVAGKLLNQIRTREKKAKEHKSGITVRKKPTLGISLDTMASKRDVLYRIPEANIPLGDDRCLVFPNLVMLPHDRIALTGANGCGKSTLVGHIMDRIQIEKDKVIYIPQEIPVDASRDFMNNVRKLSEELIGATMTVVSRLGSQPDRLLESDEPSPGELRKLILAMGIAQTPELIVMDEPTNHMDIPSIQCVEEALDSCCCGLLLVSHDMRFLEKLTNICWKFETISGKGDVRVRIV